LCPILLRYRSDTPPYYISPFTLTERPPAADRLLPDTAYNSEDLKREIARVLGAFRPTLLVLTHPADQHPDHCATYFVVQEALQELRAREPTLQPRLLTFLIHFGQWPIGEGAGTGARLSPPHGFAKNQATWMSFPLSPEEAATKRQALLHYHSQVLAMGRYLLSFARANELFAWDLEGREVETEKGRCCQQ
jgi:LmbE family N-acetylglucosaminyl deacetylase